MRRHRSRVFYVKLAAVIKRIGIALLNKRKARATGWAYYTEAVSVHLVSRISRRPLMVRYILRANWARLLCAFLQQKPVTSKTILSQPIDSNNIKAFNGFLDSCWSLFVLAACP